MNQAELIDALAEHADLSRATAGKALAALIGVVTEALKRGDEVRIAGFGTFGVSERGERQGRNPQTGAKMKIAQSKTIGFTVSTKAKKTL